MSYLLDINPSKLGFDFEKGYEHTRIKEVKLYVNNVLQHEWIATAWSKALRRVVELLQPYINKEDKFEENFNNSLEHIITDNKFTYNYCFSPKIFTDDSFITSTLYKGNKNHKLKLTTDKSGQDKYICAVYTTEVVWVLNALIQALEQQNIRLIINYEFRKDVKNEEDLNDLMVYMENASEHESDILKRQLGERLQNILFELTDIIKELKSM